MSGWAIGGSIWFHRRHLGAPEEGHSPLGATPSPALLLPQARSSQQHLDGCSGTWGTGRGGRRGAGTEQGLGRKEKRWSLSSGCSQLQRTEGYTKQAPPQPAPHSCSPPPNVHRLHSTCPWFGTKCSATGTECGYQVPLLSQMELEAPGGERVQQCHLLAARATWAPLSDVQEPVQRSSFLASLPDSPQ